MSLDIFQEEQINYYEEIEYSEELELSEGFILLLLLLVVSELNDNNL